MIYVLHNEVEYQFDIDTIKNNKVLGNGAHVMQ